MKKIIFICLQFFMILIYEKNIAQTTLTKTFTTISPGGYFDQVRDKDGKIYALDGLQIKLDQYNSNNIFVSSTTTCQAGIFKVYFANGSGMESVSNTTHTARRNTVCEVLQNISGMLDWANWTTTVSVNMLVDDIANHTTSPSTSGVLGLASAFYAYPINPASANPGIIESQIQKTIISKQDAWFNVVNPILTSGGSGFYHGVMAFNFANTSYSWCTSYNTTLALSNEFDLVTVILHEVTHSLGFASLISSTGFSKFGTVNNYYSKYDKFLYDKNLVPLIVSTGCSSQYGLAFNTANSSTINLSPNCTSSYPADFTDCSAACIYSSSSTTSNIPVYTPNCFEPPSSLSHFEDMCYPTNTPTNNNLYFSMSNANEMGLINGI